MTRVDVPNEAVPILLGKKIAVDLTPMLPGGENGGAKLMTLELLGALVSCLPQTSFVLLTAESSHSELDWLEKEHSNVQRLCVLRTISQTSSPAITSPPSLSWKKDVFNRLKILMGRMLSAKAKYYIKYFLSAAKSKSHSESLARQIGANLLFCPFTAPFYADSLIPTVSVIYDLQYRAYPQFFTPEEVSEREKNFLIATQKARYLVSISEFVRTTVIEAAGLSPDRVVAVPIGLLRSPKAAGSEVQRNKLLEKYGLQENEYIHYPANFWRHKNHAMLLTAFNLYRQANPESKLKLLCTGAPGRAADAFCEAVHRMGLGESVVYPGYVTAEEYDVLLGSAFAMAFPSLYEGFGIPVLEAMAAGVPVLSSNVTSLPEVGGEAVLYFDPRRPNEIVEALSRLSNEPDLREKLIQQGKHRAKSFAGAERMAYAYMDVFAKALLAAPNRRFRKAKE